MAKKLSLILGLLAGTLLAASPAVTSPLVGAPQITAQQQVSPSETPPKTTDATLTLEDLPPGFQELPPEITAQIASQFQTLVQQVSQQSVKPDKFTAFVNPQNFQLIVAFTGKLPDTAGQAQFDASLQQLQQPQVQQQLKTRLQQMLQAYQGIKVVDYQPLTELYSLANASTGLTLAVDMQGQPLRMDAAVFRRNAVGAFTVVTYVNGNKPTIGVGDVARKLDGKILQSSPSANR
ncbi:hypothetical protein H6F77_14760 [Microcoleus sp. FACHB-831]|uniref:hypothetical protein n=1 Tax=Microcoleus sp. FACHB-831 TaxID=2692827 RepID=UPI001689FF80|nr:hypothetical protein [Microcoleus sp. FACHB-831]MBD1922335.1 hypothetical protein [Microcoleus sp. FACHB-831]